MIKMTTVSIHQPGYLPFMGFFKKIQSCDIFVELDDVAYTRSDFDNRNRIRTHDGSMFLTVPVLNKFNQKLNEVKITNNENWNHKHVMAIKNNYQKSLYFEKYWWDLEHIMMNKWEKLLDLNLSIIKYIYNELQLETKIIKSSELEINLSGSEKILEICKKLKCTTYLSGPFGKNYLDEKSFFDSGIKVVYENFKHPNYNQIHDNFIPNLSIIDLLFNEGDLSRTILSNSINI